MQIGDRIRIESQVTSNYVIRTIENQEALDRYRDIKDKYILKVLPEISDNVCVACEG